MGSLRFARRDDRSDPGEDLLDSTGHYSGLCIEVNESSKLLWC